MVQEEGVGTSLYNSSILERQRLTLTTEILELVLVNHPQSSEARDWQAWGSHLLTQGILSKPEKLHGSSHVNLISCTQRADTG